MVEGSGPSTPSSPATQLPLHHESFGQKQCHQNKPRNFLSPSILICFSSSRGKRRVLSRSQSSLSDSSSSVRCQKHSCTTGLANQALSIAYHERYRANLPVFAEIRWQGVKVGHVSWHLHARQKVPIGQTQHTSGRSERRRPEAHTFRARARGVHG